MVVTVPDKVRAKSINARNRENDDISTVMDMHAYTEKKDSLYIPGKLGEKENSHTLNTKNYSSIKPGYHFDQVTIHAKPLQEKATWSVNTSGDVYEQEADAVAEKLIQNPEKTNVAGTNPTPVNTIQRTSETSEKQAEEEGESKEDDHEQDNQIIPQKFTWWKDVGNGKPLQRKESGNEVPSHSTAITQTLQSAGQPLDGGTRSFMEQRLGFDFSNVRIHDNPVAHQSARDINALAYTNQNNIVFGAGQYQPQTKEGQKLLAHELAHVVQQQNGAPVNLLQRKTAGNGTNGVFTAGGLTTSDIVTNKSASENKTGVKAGSTQQQPATGSKKGQAGGTPVISVSKKPGNKGAGDAAKNTNEGAQDTKAQVTTGAENKEIANEPRKTDTSGATAYLSSLQQQPPTAFITSMKSADADVNQMHTQEKVQLQKEMPVIDQPTGLPVLAKAGGGDKRELDTVSVDNVKLKTAGKPEQVVLPVSFTTEKPVAKTPSLLAQGKVDNPAIFKNVLSNSINSLPVTDDGINISLGPRPAVDLSEEADPNQVEQQTAEMDAEVMQQQESAQLLTQQDFGENNIYPNVKPEKLTPQNKLSGIEAYNGTPIAPPDVRAEISTAFDAGAAGQLKEQMNAQILKNDEAVAKMQEDKDSEHQKNRQLIDEQTAAAKKEQEGAQQAAKKEVNDQRASWINENEKIKSDYLKDGKAAKEHTEGQIDGAVKKANADIDQEYTSKEQEMAAKKAETERKAAEKKREAEEEEESGGFFSAIGDFLSDVWDSIKDAVNYLFDKLREFVKDIIDAVKKVVNDIIDAVRDVVVGFIKAFGEVLKGLVNIALAAFPELAKKINGYIDKAVDTAVDTVNEIADRLKKAVNKLLDLLGAALDFILSVYQKAFNLLIDALKFLTVGLMKILQGIANLVEAAYDSPDHFWSQVSVEVIGQDITNPLPNEIGYDKSKDETQIGNGFETVHYAKSALGIAEKEEITAEPELTSSDIVNPEVDNDFELGPEFTAQLRGQGDGETEFGETPENAELTEDERAGAVTTDSATTETPVSEAAPAQMAAPAAATTGKVGPFKNAFERGQYVLGQVKDAISKWWDANKGKVIAGLVVGLLAGAVLEVVTGGAITAAIPVIMEIVALLFAVQDVLDGIVYMGQYVTSAWVGQIAKGAMNLARTFVKLIMAFIFDLIGGGEILKGIKGTIKAAEKGGVKGALQFAKSGAKNVVIKEAKNFAKLGNIAKGGAKAAIKNGKLVLSGVKSGLKRGAKSFRELAEGLLRKFRFRKFKIEVRKFRFYLYGEVNPWVLLASGDLKEVKDKGGGKIGKQGRFMTKEGEQVEGFLVGIGGKKTSARFKNLDPEDGAKLFNELEDAVAKGKNADEIKELIQERASFDYNKFVENFGKPSADVVRNRGSLATSLEKAVGKAPDKFHEAHHLIPVELISRNEVVTKAIDAGFEFNGAANGKWIKRYSSRLDDLKDGVHAHHPNYTNGVEELINREVIAARKTAAGLTDDEAKEILESVLTQVRKATDDNPTKKIDSIFSP